MWIHSFKKLFPPQMNTRCIFLTVSHRYECDESGPGFGSHVLCPASWFLFPQHLAHGQTVCLTELLFHVTWLAGISRLAFEQLWACKWQTNSGIFAIRLANLLNMMWQPEYVWHLWKWFFYKHFEKQALRKIKSILIADLPAFALLLIRSVLHMHF